MRVIGLTGGIGMGKSTVSAMLMERSIPVWDYDDCVRNLYDGYADRGDEIYQFFKTNLPEATVNAVIDRKIVSDRAFSDDTLLHSIEMLFMYHTEVMLAEQLAYHRYRAFSPLVVLDVPLLFQMNWDRHCDYIMVVDCPEDQRHERVMKRPGMTEEKYRKIVSRQMSREDYYDHADFVIDTSKTLLDVGEQLEKILSVLNVKS